MPPLEAEGGKNLTEGAKEQVQKLKYAIKPLSLSLAKGSTAPASRGRRKGGANSD